MYWLYLPTLFSEKGFFSFISNVHFLTFLHSCFPSFFALILQWTLSADGKFTKLRHSWDRVRVKDHSRKISVTKAGLESWPVHEANSFTHGHRALSLAAYCFLRFSYLFIFSWSPFSCCLWIVPYHWFSQSFPIYVCKVYPTISSKVLPFSFIL